ncbi:MAG: acetylesterase [Candidatus Epulonipiscioides saccharophilum]|nr:MAG: acetylesterase [Epulopiscium sp. AS2M-Bin001]
MEQIKLDVPYEKLHLNKPEEEIQFTGYILQNSQEYCPDRKRPALIICPGGGYRFTSAREATPIALEFVAKGISCFVLRYSVQPNQFPTALLELCTAVKTIRDNHQLWNIDPDKIVVCGFSAGGHLAASLGVFWNHDLLAPINSSVEQDMLTPINSSIEQDMLTPINISAEQFKPNALILCYPVITAGEYAHSNSFINLLGEERADIATQRDIVSLEKHVSSSMSPTFIWHTYSDPAVPVENSLLLASAITAYKVPLELHIYPQGGHGLSLANELVNKSIKNVPTVNSWIHFAFEFIKNL